MKLKQELKKDGVIILKQIGKYFRKNLKKVENPVNLILYKHLSYGGI